MVAAGGCAGVNGCLVKPVETAALTSVCPDSKSTMGSVCGSAYTALLDCPGCMHEELETDGLSKERDEQHAQTQAGVSNPSLEIRF